MSKTHKASHRSKCVTRKKTDKKGGGTTPDTDDVKKARKTRFTKEMPSILQIYNTSATTLPTTSKATEHFASVFRSIRDHFQIETDFRKDMVGGNQDKWEIRGAGKSGSQLNYSPSKQFIIKSLPKDEYRKLCDHILAYYKHMVTHPSLLTRLCALYEVDGHYYVAMVNAFHKSNTPYLTPENSTSSITPENSTSSITPENSTSPVTPEKSTSHIYDLKGSWDGRISKTGESTKKDQDWVQTEFEGQDVWREKALAYTSLGTSAANVNTYAERFLDFMDTCVLDKLCDSTESSTLQKVLLYDVEFLKETMRVMDYSLLIKKPANQSVGQPVENSTEIAANSRVDELPVEMPVEDTMPVALNSSVCYFKDKDIYISLIDFLAGYDFKKQTQSMTKGTIKTAKNLFSNHNGSRKSRAHTVS